MQCLCCGADAMQRDTRDITIDGITVEALEQRMHVVDDRNQISSGFEAFKQIMFFQPWFWLTITALIALPPESWHTWRRIIVAFTLALFLPICNPIGERVYDWVAQNRRRIMPNSTCGIQPNDAAQPSAK